ncbi:isoprenylcysteine carboxylmethyltransferase family protein [Gramella lutea]|uniref:Isoprenylcysteine carboxylmethyltransferase family protein n=1 Tax=Christiangramia lutea TaxID=1607951 RepID=A0A9X1V4Y0_9FLAO|nr:isoprenylcysteine carboxylmethyltransferase family protein [Christiangramia lutea]MCH4824146.1 isoprenylcysteine carboxylmethyltransferase family protein [Christiangramia lutea]
MELNRKDYFFVGVQFLLFLIYFLDVEIIDFNIPSWLEVLALIIIVFGVIIFLVALLQLNRNLSPFPTPKSDSRLVKTGIYKYIRHPIYSGILITFLAYGIFTTSLFRILITFILYALFNLKSKYEEKQLRGRFPEYASYQKKTGRFFPVFFRKK